MRGEYAIGSKTFDGGNDRQHDEIQMLGIQMDYKVEEGGLDILYDLLHSGRFPFADGKDMKKFMSGIQERNRTEPRNVQQGIRKLFGAQYHIAHIHRIMRKSSIVKKSSQPVHMNRATNVSVRS